MVSQRIHLDRNMPQQEGDLGTLIKQLQSQMSTGTQTGENGNDQISQGGTLANWRAHTLPMDRMPVFSSGAARF